MTHRLGLSPIVGYLLAGLLVGPYTPGFVADRHMAEQLAEVGVILLMFGVGLHFHLEELLAVRRIAVPGAVVQSLVATALGMAVALRFRLGLVGRARLRPRPLGRQHRRADPRAGRQSRSAHAAGHIAVGWLVVEDLFTVARAGADAGDLRRGGDRRLERRLRAWRSRWSRSRP